MEHQPRVFVSRLKRLVFRAAAPVLALDGTGSLQLNRKIFGKHMTAERFAVPRDAEVYQVSTKTFSRQSITGIDRHGNPRSAQNTAEAELLRNQVIELLRLLRRGYPSAALLTMRHAGKDYDCFMPLEIGYLAQWSISDSDRGGLKRIRWQPMPEQLKQRGQGDGNKSLHR